MPLNQPLYDSLLLACQRGNPAGLAGREVIIKDPNKQLRGNYVIDASHGKPVKRLNVVDWGETYCVCCPYCNDTRHRLYINHRWGVYDKETKTKNYSLIHCFNESCEKNDDFFDLFTLRINDIKNLLNKPTTGLRPIQQSAIDQPIELPGRMIKLSELSSNHPAIVYLKSKGFNPIKLEKIFNVGWCEDSRLPQARHRIVVPIYDGNRLISWQARYVDSNGSGKCSDMYVCPNELCQQQWLNTLEVKPQCCPYCRYDSIPPRAVVKWMTAPGSKVGQHLFNYDNARAWPYCVVVEGPMDVIRVGTPKRTEERGPCVCTFKNIISYQQLVKLMIWQRTGPIFLLFDNDVWDKTLEQYNELAPQFVKGVVPVPLPKDMDPGDMTHKSVWEHIKEAARQFKVESFLEY